MSHHVGSGGTWNQFKQPEHLESISVENMDLNKSFAFFDIDTPSFSDLSFGNISLISGDGDNNNIAIAGLETRVCSDMRCCLCLYNGSATIYIEKLSCALQLSHSLT